MSGYFKRNCYMMLPRICGLCVILACVPTNGVQQLVHSAPSFFSVKKMQEVSHSYAQNKVQKDHLREFSGCFECNIYHVTVLSRLKKKGKKMNNSCFQPFQAGQFVHCYSNCRLAQPILNYATKLLMSKNTLIEAAILF